MNDQEHKENTGEPEASPVDSTYGFINYLKHPACIIGLQGDLLFTNEPFKSLVENNNNIRLDLSHPFFPEYRKRIALAYTRALKGSERQCFGVMRSSSGEKIPVEIYLFPMMRDNAVFSILVFLKPVRDDRLASFDQSTSALMEPEEEYSTSTLMDFSPFPIIRLDRNGEIIGGSSSLEAFLGYRFEEVREKRNALFKSVSLYDFERMRKAVAEIYTGGLAFKRLGEIKVTTRTKEEKWANVTIYPVMKNKDVQSVDIILEDITRTKELENRMSFMNRIQIVGDLTKGILHSFNNLVNIIMSRTQLLLQVTEKDMVIDGLKVIEKTAGDIVKQIRRVEDFIGEGESLTEYEIEDLIDIIEDAIEFAKIHFKVERKERRRNVKIERRYFSLVNVKTDTRTLREILISMIFKVSAFLRYSGTINVLLKENGALAVTVLIAKKENEQETEPDSLGGMVFAEIDIRRIAEKLNIKIFEEESADSYSIKAVLPSSIIINKGRKEPEVVEYRLRDLDIIIVEDEKTLKEILFELFDSMGNRVVMFDNGDEALAEFKKGKFDLVVTDYGIKGITGLELAARVKEVNENVVTVLLSGWMLTDLKAYKNVIDLFLPKPFKLDELIKEIAKVLQARIRK